MATPNSSAPLPTGKGRASRIPLDYYKSLNGLERTKLTLTLVALCGTAIWLAWGAFAQPNGGQARYSHGPVAAVHAKWDNDCMACHVPFSPISDQNLFMNHPATADQKCVDCHDQYKVVANDHYKKIEPGSNQLVSCGGCHRDHLGRDISLVRLPDNDCTSCHKDLKNHFKAGDNIVFANAVTSFATHPEFGAYSKGLKDPGKLKFNHKLHLMPGQVAANSAGAPLTLREDFQAERRVRVCPLQERRVADSRQEPRPLPRCNWIVHRATCRIRVNPARRRGAGATCSRSSTTPIARRVTL